MNGTVGIGSWTFRLEPKRLFTPQGGGLERRTARAPVRATGPSDSARPGSAAPEGSADGGSCAAGGSGPNRSALEVDEVLQEFVRRRDDLAVRLEAALGDDQAGELLGEVHVGHLQCACGQGATTAAAGRADQRVARVVARPVGAVP